MKRDKLERFIGENVKITLFDNTVIKGELHKTGEEDFKHNATLYLLPKRYFLINPQSCLFRCSHVKKLKKS